MWTRRYSVSQRSDCTTVFSIVQTHYIVFSICNASWDTHFPYSLFSYMTDGAPSCLGGLHGRRWKSTMSSECHDSLRFFTFLMSLTFLSFLKLSISQALSTFLSLSFSFFHGTSPRGLWSPYIIAVQCFVTLDICQGASFQGFRIEKWLFWDGGLKCPSMCICKTTWW